MNKRKPRRSKNVLPLEVRMAVIHDYKTLTKNARVLSERYGCGRTQIQNIIKARNDLTALYRASKKTKKDGCKRKQTTRSVPEAASDAMAIVLSEWSLRSQAHELQITQPLLESAAENIAPLLGIEDCRPKEGWVKSILSKYDFSFDRAQDKAPDECLKSLKYTDIMDELGVKYNIPPGMEYYSVSVPPVLESASTAEASILGSGKSFVTRIIKRESVETLPSISIENDTTEKEAFSIVSQNHPPTCAMKEVSSYREALNVLGPLERFALLKGNVRAVGLINQMENLFRDELEKILWKGT